MSVQDIRNKIPVVLGKGSNYEIGFAHGSQAKAQVNITLNNL